MSDLFEHMEKTTGGQITAEEIRKGCRNWLIIFAIATTALVIALYAIWTQL